MSRSVSTPNSAALVAYSTFEPEDEFDASWEWDDLIEWTQDAARKAWPSLETADRWLGNEDHVILENELVQIGVSEYCGVVATWVVPQGGEHANLETQWIDRIAARFDELFGSVRLVGRFSNGEVVYERREG